MRSSSSVVPGLVLLLGSTLACNTTNARPAVLVDPDLLPLVSARAATWRAPRTPLAFADGEASNCAEYARLRDTGMTEGVNNQLVRSEYLICDVLGRLAPSVAVEPLAGDGQLGEALARRLDLRSFPSSLGPRLDAERHTLAALFEARDLKIEAHRVEVASDAEGTYSLEVVLVGDLDQSGVADWLVWFSDEAAGGNYRAYATLLVTDVAREGALQARSPVSVR